MKITPVKWLLAAACGGLLSSCITHEETVVRDVDRSKVEFENDRAARIFYEAMSKNAGKEFRTESKTEVGIPVVFDHKRRVVTGPNAEFNQAVALCDSNKDGIITETEAKIFADQRQKH